MSDQLTIPELSYFQKRMTELGVTEELNSVMLWQNVENENTLVPFPVFRGTEKGIDILVYTVDGYKIRYAKEGSRWKHHEFCITRLEHPITSKKGDLIKYLLPKDQPTQPFFPPMLVEAFRAKTKIKTLVITEGYFKAFKAAMHGMPCVGLSSITHMKDKNTGNLHDDIKRLILTCEVENVIWLMDGDCRNISSKDIETGVDLRKRPYGFFQTCSTFKDLLDEFDVKRWVAHQLSEDLPQQAKGIDDLLCAVPGEEQLYVEELINLSRKPQSFFRLDITFNVANLHRYFLLNDIDAFVLHHSATRPDLLTKEFVFNGTRYKWNAEKNTAEVVVPAEANNYFRVGDQYHAFVHIPNKYGEIERTFHRRMKGTIADDHGKSIFKHVPKYQAFCNVPNHIDYQPVINGCFNMYAPFEHEPEEGEWKTIEAFCKHIFGTGDINWTDPKTKEKMVINELDLGYDYLTLLYKKPTQILPILCLVSRENGTGKSTLGKLLKLIFTQNAAVVGNAELSDNFNASWASKLLVICDEAKIDKQVVVEKVKALSTTDKIFMNAKGKDHVEIDFFGKFLFFTNNEDNFIYASDDDVRYWIRKVPKLQQENLDVNMLQKMQEEIPAFLHFLETRPIKVPNRHRAWFDPELIKTEALKKVIEYSKPTIEKEIRAKVREKFFEFGITELYMGLGEIKENFELKRYENNYLEKVLRNDLKVDTYHKWEYNGNTFATKEEVLSSLNKTAFDAEDLKLLKRKNLVKRYSYPRWERVTNSQGIQELRRVDVNCNGRPYVFKINDFLSPDEIDSIEVDAETKAINEANELHNHGPLFSGKDLPPWEQ